MKKTLLIVGISVAAVLIASSAFAAGSSLVGKKVEKTVMIEVDGKKTGIEAVVIGGVTYAPVRNIGETAGYNVALKNGVVKLQSDGKVRGVAEDKELEMKGDVANIIKGIDIDIDGHRRRIQFNNEDIVKRKEAIQSSVESFEKYAIYKEQGMKYEESDAYQKDLKYIADLEAENEKLQTEITELERKKAELTANK